VHQLKISRCQNYVIPHHDVIIINTGILFVFTVRPVRMNILVFSIVYCTFMVKLWGF